MKLGCQRKSVLNVKALVGTFNKEKALVGVFSVIVKLMDRVTALPCSGAASPPYWRPGAPPPAPA